jgi:hypothetical protein
MASPAPRGRSTTDLEDSVKMPPPSGAWRRGGQAEEAQPQRSQQRATAGDAHRSWKRSLEVEEDRSRTRAKKEVKKELDEAVYDRDAIPVLESFDWFGGFAL